jgi:hypothetical protein
MTEELMSNCLKDQLAKRNEEMFLDNILRDPVLRKERVKARMIYRKILFFRHTPKEKKELWRCLGKCLSLKDFEFE